MNTLKFQFIAVVISAVGCGQPTTPPNVSSVLPRQPVMDPYAALLPCPACLRDVSPTARTCPSCGHDLKAFSLTVMAVRDMDSAIRELLKVKPSTSNKELADLLVPARFDKDSKWRFLDGYGNFLRGGFFHKNLDGGKRLISSDGPDGLGSTPDDHEFTIK